MDQALSGYFSAAPVDRQPLLGALHDMVLRLYPQADVSLDYKMPTYRVGDGWVAIANQKHYVSLYTRGYRHIERFKQRYPQIKTGKGCINLRARDDIPWPALEHVVRHAIEHPKTQPALAMLPRRKKWLRAQLS